MRNLIPYREEPDYPKVGTPMEIVRMMNPIESMFETRLTRLESRFMGHILLSKSEGIFIEPEFDSESSALSYSAEVVVEMRKNGTGR